MLKDLRTMRGISKVFVAKKLNINRDRLTRIEKGKSDLPAKLVPILSELYGVSQLDIISSHRSDLDE